MNNTISLALVAVLALVALKVELNCVNIISCSGGNEATVVCCML